MSDHVELGAASGRALESSFDLAELTARVERSLARVLDNGRVAVLTWPMPRVPCERLLAVDTAQDAVLWAPAGEGEICALGSAITLVARGADRFTAIERQARDVWPMLDLSGSDRNAPRPRFLGGFAFQAGQAESKLWQNFGDARFVLPRLSYVKDVEGAWLRLIVRSAELSSAAQRAELVALVRSSVQALLSPTLTAASEPARVLAREERSAEDWAELIAAIQREIKSGRAQKIVAARRVSLRLDKELVPALVQARLAEHAPESNRFAFRVAGATFLGATPEGLLRKRGAELTTEAVAGSVSADDTASATRLLESGKDKREHEFVVSEILRVLEPLTSELAPGKREVHRLRTVLHLRTPIHARLREASHVLELVGRLHPTPAVGGVPTAAALEFITRHEPDERGWYAGPVGWFDAAGDGRFVVALRSGIVDGARAELYAGAGIVQDSNAPSELAETRWKLAALLGALGVRA
jgi:menaquinone-specific isochorismate synthase